MARRSADALATLVAEYEQAEAIILERLAARLARGLAAPDWQLRKMLEIQTLRRSIQAVLNPLAAQGKAGVAEAIAQAYASARGAGVVADTAAGLFAANVPSLQRLLQESVTDQLLAHQRILRDVDDVYRQVIAQVGPGQLLGVDTRRQVMQRALDKYAERGVTGFVDRRGRRWEMTSHVEMSTRTVARHANREGLVDRLRTAGRPFVVVSNHAQECSLCRPWEGKVLTIDPSAMEWEGERAHATLDAALRAGLQHPNCRHRLSSYTPGITPKRDPQPDPEGDAARQRQRALERQVRAAKRREAVALDPQAAAKARARVRDRQAALRDHVSGNGLKRQRDRERPQLGLRRQSTPQVVR